MQFTLKEIRSKENGKEIVGINYNGEEVTYPYSGTEDIEEINSKCNNCQIIFDEGRVTGAWDHTGKPIYTPSDKTMGNDSVVKSR